MKRNGAYVMALPRLAEDVFALPLKDIAAQNGFGSANSLIRTFEKYEGMTPGEYRRAAC